MAFEILNVHRSGSHEITIEVAYSNGEIGQHRFPPEKWTNAQALAEIAAEDLRLGGGVEDSLGVKIELFSLKGQTFEPVKA